MKAIEITVTQSWPNIPFRMSFEEELPVLKNRNISKPNKKTGKMAAPPQTTLWIFFFWLAFAVLKSYCFHLIGGVATSSVKL